MLLNEYILEEHIKRFQLLSKNIFPVQPLFSLDENIARHAIGEKWWAVLNYHKNNNVKVRNIIAITSKSARKTKIVLMWMLFKMNTCPWLNAFIYRDTQERAVNQMSPQIRDTIRILGTEYGVKDIFDHFEEVTTDNSVNLVRKKVYKGKKVRDNQKISLESFEEAVIKGGFTTANGFEALHFFEELQNPSGLNKNQELLTREQFESEFKLINGKNDDIIGSTKIHLDLDEPRNFFMSNRYNDQHPLTEFANEHFPWESTEDIKGAKDWMLEDPINNNFIVHYVDKANKGWEFLNNTLIVYASKFSNEIIMNNPIKKQELLDLLDLGRPIDLAIAIGDLFEGYDVGNFAYHYENRESVTEETFLKELAPYAIKCIVGVDRNFSRHIVAIPKYLIKKPWFDKYNNIHFEYRLIRGIPIVITSNKVGRDGIPSEEKFNEFMYQIHQLKKYIKDNMPLINHLLLIIDNDGGEWVGRINKMDFQDKDNFIRAYKMYFKKEFPINERPVFTSQLQESKFIIDIENSKTLKLHKSYQNVRLNESGKRIKKVKDPWTDFWDADESGNFLFKIYFKKYLRLLKIKKE